MTQAGRFAAPGLYCASGFAALVYEVLWMKELSLLFGNTAHASATALTAFFLGIAAGSRYWGARATRTASPLRTFGLLEFGVAAGALAYFWILVTYRWLYPSLYRWFADALPLLLAAKFLLALFLLFPPAFFMGGTFPMMGQYFIRRARGLGYSASLLYAVNTLGAAVGAFLAGFALPHILGFQKAYWLAILTNCGIGAAACFLAERSRIDASSEAPSRTDIPNPPEFPAEFSDRAILALAVYSGFLTLALEVLWIRMFSQALQNSVYTYSSILVVFLVCLSLGGALGARLAICGRDSRSVLTGLLTLGGFGISMTPLLFYWATSGLLYVGGARGWAGYVMEVFGIAFLVLLVPGVLIGAVFPYLFKLSESKPGSVGGTLGRLAAWNTGGAIFGSVAAGFVALEIFGLWTSLRLAAGAYFLAALAVAIRSPRRGLAGILLPIAGCLGLFTILNASRLPLVKLSQAGGEKLLEAWEGSAGTTAVIETPKGRFILFNNYYTVGGQTGKDFQAWMGRLPLLLQPNPREVFFLGMGTGITAGAAVDHPVERIVVCELIGDIARASRKYFGPDANGLFEDPRFELRVEDGRHYLAAVDATFDVIVSDLFIPWEAGTGSLYTVDHFRTASRRLREGGVYAQWTPLYQFSDAEFGALARSMLEVFPLVTLWRGDFLPDQTIALLMGHQENAPLDPARIERTLALPTLRENRVNPPSLSLFLSYYVGNLTEAKEGFASYPLNTDNRPWIEYHAPLVERDQAAGRARFLVGPEMITFYEKLQRLVPPETDPFLARLSMEQKQGVLRGLDRHRAAVTGGMRSALSQPSPSGQTERN